jgi:hypothetical protein
MLSNNNLICRLGATAGILGVCIAFLQSDHVIAPGVCGLNRNYQQPIQLDESGQIDARRPNGHPGADRGIEHPAGHRDHDAGWSKHLEKLAGCALLHSADIDFTAKIWMPFVMDFQLLPDMGRMKGG